MEYFVPRELILSEDSYVLIAYLAVRMVVSTKYFDPASVRTTELLDFIYNGEDVPAARQKRMQDSLDKLLEDGWVSGEKVDKDRYLIKEDTLLGASKSFIIVAQEELMPLLSRTLMRKYVPAIKTYLVILASIFSKTKVTVVALNTLKERTGYSPKALISHIKLLEDLHLLAVGRYINDHKMGNVYARYADKKEAENWMANHRTAVR